MPIRFDIAAFVRRPDAVARLVRADEVFSLRIRQLVLPTECVALVWGDGDQPFTVHAGRAVEAGAAREFLLVRTVPFTLGYDIAGLASKDGYACSAAVQMTVQVVPDRAELAAFRRSVLGSLNEANIADLTRHCGEVVSTALAAFAKAHDAAELLQPATWDAFDPVLAEHFKPLGFESGLALGRDPRVAFLSPAYQQARRTAEAEEHRQKRQEADQRLRQAAAEARKKELAEVGTLLDQVKRLPAENPAASIADVIKMFDPAQRGALYEGLVALPQPARRTQAILLVAGDELLWFDPADLAKPTRRLSLASEAGPLRSVRLARQGDKAVLLVGARRGVHVVDANGGLGHTYLAAPGIEPRGGFNSSVLRGDDLCATHSEIGLACWKLARGEPETPASDSMPALRLGMPAEPRLADVTAGAKIIRDVQLDDAGRLWFSMDSRVVGWSPDESGPPTLLAAPVVVTALVVAAGRVYGGLDDGRIIAWDIADPTATETLRGPTGQAVQSLDWTSGGGIPRLLIADGRPQLDYQVLGDAYLGTYACNQRLRWGLAAEDCLVAVNDRRDLLLLWHPDDAQRPAASVSIGQLCGRSIQDVILLPLKGDA